MPRALMLSPILPLLLAGCPKQPNPPSGVLSAADVQTLRDGQILTRTIASLPQVQADAAACRGFVYLDALWTQTVQIGEGLVTPPACFGEIRVDAQSCPPRASDPVLTEAAALEVASTAEVLEQFVRTVQQQHIGDPVVAAWADLSTQRLVDVVAEVSAELAEPDDLLVLPEVCHAE